MPKPPSTWKNFERFVAQYLGLQRRHWAPEDVGDDTEYAIECKHGAQIPKTILKWWDQAQTNAGDRTPALILHPPRWKYENSLVCITLKEYKRLLDGSN